MSTENGGERTVPPGLAPVIPLFADRRAAAATDAELDDAGTPSPRHPAHRRGGSVVAFRESEESVIRPRTIGGAAMAGDDEGDDGPTIDEVMAAAEDVLVRRLRGRQLSVREARDVLAEQVKLRGAAGDALSDDRIEEILDRFQTHGYLDDRSLAEHLVRTGVERKGQGRSMLSRTLAQRGIPASIVSEALDELSDDDEDERALEYARSAARSMANLDFEVALRRLAGRLARRGFGGSSLSVARKALQEVSAPPRHSVRFE